MFYVDLKNVGIIKEAHLGFVPGVNLILGASSSGKSTLLRALHSLADNSFTDSMVTHGCGMMQIDVKTPDAQVTYTRDTKARDRKACYVVNGEEYTKLGRQQLDVVASSLKLSSVKIDSENINFNFSSQFSGPFLLLGSPSTLYSVLTYHDSFDVTRLDDLYKEDVKSLTDSIRVNRKMNECLVEEDRKATAEFERLSGVPELYAKVAALKVKIEHVTTLRSILLKMRSLKSHVAHSESLLRLNSEVQARIMATLMKMRDYLRMEKMRRLARMRESSQYNLLLSEKIHSYDTVRMKSQVQSLNSLRELARLLGLAKRVEFKLNSSSSIAVYDMTRVSGKMHDLIQMRKLCVLMQDRSRLENVLGVMPDYEERFLVMERCLKLIHLTEHVRESQMRIMSITADLNNVEYEFEKIGVCPLCGNVLCGAGHHT